MNLFYTPDISDGIYTLSEDESKHCRMVLRLREGDVIHLTDGRGNLFETRILDARSRLVTAEILQSTKEYGKRNYHLHLAVAPTKNIERFEWFLEKATEIGVDEITPLVCEHSERRHLRNDRLEKVITAALKQSLKAYHPVLNDLTDFNSFISGTHQGQLFIAHHLENDPVLLQALYRKAGNVIIMVGPEGDFSPSEVSSAITRGFQCVSLGNSRLRTETAAVASCHSIYMLNS